MGAPIHCDIRPRCDSEVAAPACCSCYLTAAPFGAGALGVGLERSANPASARVADPQLGSGFLPGDNILKYVTSVEIQQDSHVAPSKNNLAGARPAAIHVAAAATSEPSRGSFRMPMFSVRVFCGSLSLSLPLSL